MSKRVADLHFDSVRRQLLELLTDTSVTANSSAIKGRLREGFVNKFLKNHLPSLADYANGELLDIHDSRSGEIDIILRSSWSPRLHLDSGVEVVPVDSALACIEIKSRLTTASFTRSSELRKSLRASYRVKSLHRQNLQPAPMAWGDTFRNLKKKTPYLLVAYKGPKLQTLRRRVGEVTTSPDANDNLSTLLAMDIQLPSALADYWPDAIVVLDPPYYLTLDDGILVPSQSQDVVFASTESCLSLLCVYLTRLVELWNNAPPPCNFKAYTDPLG